MNFGVDTLWSYYRDVNLSITSWGRVNGLFEEECISF